MRAIALSGGGNRGPLQIGALQALAEAGLWPDLWVGTSAGALNAAYVAARGTPDALADLVRLWREVRPEDVYPGNLLTMAWRALRGQDSLYPNHRLRAYILDRLPPDVNTFGDLAMPCYITATDLRTARLYLFGKELTPDIPLVDGVLASATVPGIHPPVVFGDLQLVDGGVVDNVPASLAMDRGATEIYAVNVGYGGQPMQPVHGVHRVLGRVLTAFMAQSLLTDLDRAAREPQVILHHIRIPDFPDIRFNDFSQVDAMVEAGRRRALEYLAAPQPLTAGQVFQEAGLGPNRGAGPLPMFVPPHHRPAGP